MVFLAFFSWSCQEKASSESGFPTARIDSLLQAEMNSGRFQGQVVIGDSQDVLYSKELGLADRNWEIPVASDTRFDIASVNKSLIAGLILIARQEGKLELDQTLESHLSGFNYSGNFNPEITLHHMLTHSSGLPDYDRVNAELAANGFARFKRLHFSNPAYVDFISQLEPVAKPSERFYYSNFAYHLLAIILENSYQKPFSAILKEKITDPLGMEQTFSTSSNEEVFQRVAEGYNYDSQTDSWTRNNFIDLTLGRRIFSTATDLYKWARECTEGKILNESSRQLMAKNHLMKVSSEIAYGYGWVPYLPGEEWMMGNLSLEKPYLIHGGSTEGYKAMLLNVNQGEWILALLANTGSQTDESGLTKKIVNLLPITQTHE